MFFIGGYGHRVKDIGPHPGKCPVCGHNRLHITRHSDAFSAFFITLFQLNQVYWAVCPHCASVMELTPETGRKTEGNTFYPIRRKDLRVLQNNAAY